MDGRAGVKITLEEDPLWYKNAVIYELHPRAFYDSNDDGIGDFQGLIRKLPYLEWLGITAIWLLPFYPSPLKDDGYDIAYYFDLHPDYGTLKDFREFLRQAHKRGIRVITEIVLNHTSDQHPWFRRARKARPGSVRRNYYVWSDTPEKYREARIIFQDFETSNWAWDPAAKAYYWHRFYSHQPDLNFDNPFVRNSILKVVDNWLNAGVDGLRLDAVPYLIEREGTNCENLPETHEYLKMLRKHVDGRFKNRMLIAEANQWPEDAAAYFGNGEECHMAFHFPIMPRLFMAIQMEDRFPIIDILEQTPRIPDSCQWGLFLRNHDELTLEMVTDEERDYMYRVYARDPRTRLNLGIRRRLAPLMGNNRRKIELMNILLFSLPGTPVIYYGDEIGMGDNYYLGDRNGVRTPMQWSADRNAGFSRANPQRLYLPINIDPEYHYEALNVENQERNTSSLLWWMKRVIAMRRRMKALSRGDLTFLPGDNHRVLAFTRSFQGETMLVVINLSRFSQAVELDLSEYAGHVPVEVFSRNRFPMIKDSPYLFTTGLYDYYWFSLVKEEVVPAGEERALPKLSVRKTWTAALEGKALNRLEEEVLPAYFYGSRWFGAKGRAIHKITVIESVPFAAEAESSCIALTEVTFTEGASEWYLLPLAFVSGEKAVRIAEEWPKAVISRLSADEEEGLLIDAVYDERFRAALLRLIAGRKKVKGSRGSLIAYPGRKFRGLRGERGLSLASEVLKADQTNTSIVYEDIFFLKLYRRPGEGMNPDLEIIRFLADKTGYANVPTFAGGMEYLRPGVEPVIIGNLQGFVPNQGDAWTYTLDEVRQYFERVLSEQKSIEEVPPLPPSLSDVTFSSMPPVLQELIGGVFPEKASLLGQRTGELHLALSSETEAPDFAPEPLSLLYQRSVYQSMRNLTRRVLLLLQKNLKKLPEDVRESAARLLEAEQEILALFQRLFQQRITASKIRYHGDLHLGQVLHTGKDFAFIDFEGEPARPLSERRLKSFPLRDVAGMVRSFHYAVSTALVREASVRPEDTAGLEPWADAWFHAVSGIFLNSYVVTVGDAAFMPKDRKERNLLLKCFLLEKAVYEVGYELNNRPEQVIIPLRGIEHILKHHYLG